MEVHHWLEELPPQLMSTCVFFFVLQGSHIHLAEDALSAAQVAIDRLRVATPPPQVCEANSEGAGI